MPNQVIDHQASPVEYAHSKVRINVWVPKHLRDGALEVAGEESWSLTAVVCEALKKYVRAHKTKVTRRI